MKKLSRPRLLTSLSIDFTSSAKYDSHHHKHHSIYAGTTVLMDFEDRNEEPRSLAPVIKTGSYTMKGKLLGDILFGAPYKF